MSIIRLIIGREFLTRIKKRSFAVTIVISILVLIAYVYVPVIISALSGSSQTKVTVINTTNQSNFGGVELKSFLDDYLNTTVTVVNGQVNVSKPKKLPYDITYKSASETEALKTQVKDGKLNGVLTIARSNGELTFDYYTKDGTRGTSTQRISDAATRLTLADRLGRAGVSSQITSTPANINITDTDLERSESKGTGKTEAQMAASYGVVLILVIVLFISIQSYGAIIAQGVAEEKSNRVMEIIISAATPFQLLFGKVIGIGLLGILSIGIIAAIGVPAIMLQGPVTEALLGDASANSFNLSGFDIATLGYFLMFYLLGYFLYATLYAAAGSLCTRTEDVQQALAPLTTLLMIAYFVSIFGLQAIDAVWVQVLSFVPFFSPIIMFARISFGTVSPLEVIISLVLLAAAVVVCAWAAARIYRTGVLLYGKRPSMLQALGLARASK